MNDLPPSVPRRKCLNISPLQLFMKYTHQQPIVRRASCSCCSPWLPYHVAAAGPQGGPEPKARPDLVRAPYSVADVDFMAGMIPHHAQAVLMAGWAARTARAPTCAILCERIVVAQRDEIEMMRTWLRDRGADGACRRRDASPDEDERRRARHADAGHAQSARRWRSSTKRAMPSGIGCSSPA